MSRREAAGRVAATPWGGSQRRRGAGSSAGQRRVADAGSRLLALDARRPRLLLRRLGLGVGLDAATGPDRRTRSRGVRRRSRSTRCQRRRRPASCCFSRSARIAQCLARRGDLARRGEEAMAFARRVEPCSKQGGDVALTRRVDLLRERPSLAGSTRSAPGSRLSEPVLARNFCERHAPAGSDVCQSLACGRAQLRPSIESLGGRGDNRASVVNTTFGGQTARALGELGRALKA